MEEFRRIKRELVAKGAIIDYYQDTMQIPNGNIAKWDLIDHKGAAAVVAVREDGKLLMVRQYRNGAGAGDSGDSGRRTEWQRRTYGSGSHAGIAGRDRLSYRSCGTADFHLYHSSFL